MDKFLVEVYVPVLEKKFEMFLPANSKLYYVVKTMCRYMDSLEENYRFGNMDCVLTNSQNGVIYDHNMTVYEAGIKNGSKLILM